MEQIPPWAVASSGMAPTVLVGGWLLAARRQPAGYDPCRDTISALAGRGASDRWLMTGALAGLGMCHIVTAAGLKPAGSAGRAMLAGGGAATLFVAGVPLPEQGGSRAHAISAAASFFALGVWPMFAARRATSNPALRVGASVSASAVLLALVAWFVSELGRDRAGLAERVAAGSQASWPLVVVLVAKRIASPRRTARH